MSVIKTCGGYDKAKVYVEQFKKLNLDGAVLLFEAELLEYRRANNVFEEGDRVVMLSKRRKNIIWTWRHTTNWRTNHSLLSCGDNLLHPISNDEFRHATDIEIAQGYRS